MDTTTTPALAHVEKVRAAKIEAMAAGSHIFHSGRTMLLVPHGRSPANASGTTGRWTSWASGPPRPGSTYEAP